ncbi:MAG: HYR domain-containing protein [Chloroflexota bacterium]
MKKTVHLLFSVFLILLIMGLSLANTGTVLADEGDPTDVPVVEPTEPPTEETPEPQATPLPEENVATPVPEESSVDLLAQVPENTNVVVLDENGETVSLASQAAADMVEIGDPMWCPEGTLPGGLDCTDNYDSIAQLLAVLTGDNIADYQRNGIIYFTAGSSGGNFTLTSGSVGSPDFGRLNDYHLTLQGGWDGEYLDLADFNGQTDFASNTVTIGSFNTPWNGNVTINNMIFNNVPGTSLTVYTYGDDITLNNVDVTYTNPATDQSNSSNVVLDTSRGNQTGDITIGAGSSFDNGTNGAGLYANAENGDIMITGVTGQPITFTDANGDGTGTNYNGATLAGDTVILTNVSATNNDGNGIIINNPDLVFLNNVAASNNGTDQSNPNDNIGSGVNVSGVGNPATVVINGGNFSNNQRYGVEVSNSLIVIHNTASCSNNDLSYPGTGNCFNQAPASDTTAPDTIINSGPRGTVNNTTATFSFSGTDNLTPGNLLSFECRLDGAGFGACSSPISYSGLAPGSHTFRVRAVDLAGNVDATPSSRTWRIDIVAPNVAITLPLPNGANDWFITSPVNGTVVASDNISVNSLDCSGVSSQGAPNGIGTSNASRSISITSNGIHNITCTASDGTNSSQGTASVKIDTTSPTAATTVSPAPNTNGWNNTSVTVTFSGNDTFSGIDFCDASVVLSSEAAAQAASGTCTDRAGHVSPPVTASNINIDMTAPVLSLPGDFILEAASSAGFPLFYTATVTDNLDGSVGVNCLPASGSTFGIGTTTVSCSSTDQAGNTASGSFTVTVRDTTAPTLSLPADMTEEAVGPAGNVVTFTATASDAVDGALPVTCTPASGSTFAIAVTTVTCSATDSAENTVTETFTVTVRDTTAPVIASHPDVFIKTSFPDGEDVYYGASSTTDIVDGTGLATCSPASGSIFPAGDTVVTCTAVDAHGNAATPITFTVHVFEAQIHFAGGADLLIPLTGSSSFTIACKNPQSFHVATESARIFFNNMCGYDAVVEGLESASLPGKLPSGASFRSGFTIDVLQGGKSIDPLPKNTSITLEFDIEGDLKDEYSILTWNGTAWVEVKGEKTADGYFSITLTEGGTFIIVQK